MNMLHYFSLCLFLGGTVFAMEQGNRPSKKQKTEIVSESKTQEQESLNQALLKAVNDDNLAEVERLVHQGADVNCGDCADYSPLFQAESVPMVELLIMLGAKVNALGDGEQTALEWETGGNNIEKIECLLKHGADINVAHERRGFITPINAAVFVNNLPVIQCLMRHGADVTIADEKGETPLHIAARHKSVDAMRELVKAKVNLDIEQSKSTNNTPLDNAILAKCPEIVALLLNHKACVNARARSFTPLRLALQDGSPDMVQLLIKHGADINGSEGPLSLAIAWSKEKAVKLLLEHGADVEAKHDNVSPWEEAIKTAKWATEDAEELSDSEEDAKGDAREMIKKLLPIIKELLLYGAKVSDYEREIAFKMLKEAFKDEPLMLAVILRNGQGLTDNLNNASKEHLEAALAYAAVQGNKDYILQLLGAGASPANALAVLKKVMDKRPSKDYNEIYKQLLQRSPTLVELIIGNPNLSKAFTDAKSIQKLPRSLQLRVNPKAAFLNAFESRFISNIKAALQEGTNPNVETRPGISALLEAALENNIELVELLLYYGAQPNEDMLRTLCLSENSELKKEIITRILKAVYDTYMPLSYEVEEMCKRVLES